MEENCHDGNIDNQINFRPILAPHRAHRIPLFSEAGATSLSFHFLRAFVFVLPPSLFVLRDTSLSFVMAGRGRGGASRGRGRGAAPGKGSAIPVGIHSVSDHITTVGVKRPSFGKGGQSVPIFVNAFETTMYAIPLFP